MQELVLYSRQGCCLCEGLEQRLEALNLMGLGVTLQVIDLDGAGVTPELKARYDLEVPVLVVQGRELPRVSPRLSGEGLFNWLQRALSNPSGSA